MQLSKKDIEELLKKGAYGAIMDEDNVADQFCEEDIDQILQRRTQVIKIESEGKGSTFSKVLVFFVSVLLVWQKNNWFVRHLVNGALLNFM